MLQHHLLLSCRNLQKHKGSFFINLIGLSTGLACAFLIFLWVHDEQSFDRFHANGRQLYQVMERSTENGNVIVHEATQGPLAAAMKKDLPEVEAAVPVLSLEKEKMFVQIRAGDKAVKTTGQFAGTDFFRVFSFPLSRGQAATALNERNSIVLSHSLAISLFGSEEAAMGKSLDWEILGDRRQSVVTGILAPLPSANSMRFDFVMPWDLLYSDIAKNFQFWWNEGPSTYLLLKKGTEVPRFEKKITSFLEAYHKGSIFTLFLRPYSSGYLHGKYENGVVTGGRIEYVRLFSIVALFILLIACINFMNLSTARAARRLKEVGIKKAIGATRGALTIQFLVEAVFMAFLALLLAGAMVSLLLPEFNRITGKELSIALSLPVVLFALGVTVLTGLISGSYPAFYLSGFEPVAVLKGKLKNSFGELMARKGLVVFQFIVSLVLIVSVLVIYRQVNYVQTKNPGYDKAHVIHFDREGRLARDPEAFLDEVRKVPGVLAASAVQQNLVQSGGTGPSTYGIEWPGKSDKDLVDFTVRAVDYGLLEAMGIQLKEGRSFAPSYGAEEGSIIFNETAIRIMGLKNPLGTRVRMWGKDKTIVGVVRDFHVTSLHEAIGPLLFYFSPQQTNTVMVKLDGARERAALEGVAALYRRFNPGFVFDYHFLDEAYQAQYVSEQRVSVLSRYFAGLAILISLLGLFGLAAFNAEIRTKEIGIRKVLGASVRNVTFLLSKDFLRLVLLAILIAFPLSWWAMNRWLDSFAYRVNLGFGVFFIAGISLLVFVLGTVSLQSVRTALKNPVKSLRSE